MAMEKTMRLPNFDKDKIGLVVGPSASACEKNRNLRRLPSLRKNVFTPTWKSFTLHKEKNGHEGDDPKTPYIELNSDEEGVFATVKSDSELMMKFAMFHLDKYHQNFKEPTKKMYHNVYVTMDHNDIPRLIGKGASVIKDIRDSASEQLEERVSEEELTKIAKAFVKVDKFSPRDMDDFTKMVGENDRASFAGWPPSEEDEIVKVSLSCLCEKQTMNEFVEYFMDFLLEKVKNINQKTRSFKERKGAELAQAEEALSSDW
jgi:hypothetical protein